jgi:aminoglycoside phosphotransferase
MKQYILMLALLAVPAITAIEQDNQVTLTGNDNSEVEISRDIAEKIPLVAAALRSGMREAQTQEVSFQLLDTAMLQNIINVVQDVYNNAPVLQQDPQFFTETDDHPAFTPADIPRQVRNIINKHIDKPQQNTLIQAADFLGLDWTVQAFENPKSKSIADLVVSNTLLQIIPGRLDLANRDLTSLAGMHLIDKNILNNLKELDLGNNQLHELQPGILNGLQNLQMLHVENNQLKELQPDLFNGLQNLVAIELKGNQLQKLQPSVFNELQNRAELNLSNNQLSQENQNQLKQALPEKTIIFD